MLTVDIICVGRLKERYWHDACEEYCKRLTPWAKVNIVEINEERCRNAAPSLIETVIAAEGERILSALPPKAYVIALCIEGKRMTSPALAEEISHVMLAGNSTLAFVIGGSYGLSPAVKTRADLRLSMSDLTFPHQFARVMLLEQIYRSMSIIQGGKYHK
jgi:23S rRNA (pseudouridine1915-N3)-methyltransferase